MRIAIDARLYGLENAGLGRYVINLIDQLSRIDTHNEYILLLRGKHFDSLKVPDNWTKVKVDCRHYSLREQVEVPWRLRKINPDLVHFPHFNVPFFYKSPFVVTIHDILMHKIKGKDATTLPKHKYAIKRLGYKSVFSHAIGKSRKIIVPSKSARKELMDYYKIDGEKVVVTYEGYSAIVRAASKTDIFEKFKIKQPYFFYVGNSYPHKNLERLIAATASLNEKGVNANLVIATSVGVFGDRLSGQIKKHNAQKHVRLLGHVSDQELAGLYKYSSGLVYPSLIEGFGLQGIEALSNGTIPLLSDISVFREIYKEHAVYFNPFDFSAIEQSMADVLGMDKAKKKRIIAHGREFVKKYSWEKMARATMKVYEESSAGL